jgi:predicted alpha/beta-fold hydrolase
MSVPLTNSPQPPVDSVADSLLQHGLKYLSNFSTSGCGVRAASIGSVGNTVGGWPSAITRVSGLATRLPKRLYTRVVDSVNDNIDSPVGGVTIFICIGVLVCLRAKYKSIVGESGLLAEVDCSEQADEALVILAKKIVSHHKYFPTYLSVLGDYHGQLQTITQFTWRTLLVKFLPICRHRELLHLDDGGLVSLDWLDLKHRYSHSGKINTDIPTVSYGEDHIVVISHGLCGSASSDYIAHFSEQLLRAGYRVCVVIRRGCAGLHIPRPTALFQHRNCEVTDLGHALQHISKNNPNSSLYGLGYSMGAAHWLKELGALGSSEAASLNNGFDGGVRSKLKAAVCVSPPWNMSLHTSVFHLWSPLLALGLKYHLSKHIPSLNALGVDFNDVSISIL